MTTTFRKHSAARLVNYLFLIPFILAYRPLLIRYNGADLLWYTIGVSIILIIIYMSNRRPYVILDETRLILNLHYYQNPEVHILERITLIEPIGSHSCRIHSRDFNPVRISLNPKDLKKFMATLSQRNIKIKTL
ncbi:hypothetical protein EXM22_04855 [Oceanispirochaeta crateris]|uniref:PH domain-containing protein n=1 Tax=Oceanispirochaeta crateris TaxID=2518645 RepID=A0A5C1QK24_9SPIO|nr:hypothetical protein [Oceanispirochaeta crateris]QEN07350.1 hypothetical protein EXM22_04855 [Oceanispirochaeta crateris]